jgi:hypothetical protein
VSAFFLGFISTREILGVPSSNLMNKDGYSGMGEPEQGAESREERETEK